MNENILRIRKVVSQILLAAFIACSPATSLAALLGNLRTVALSGVSAPGAQSGQVFSGFNLPDVNAQGRTTFLGFLQGTEVNGYNNTGVWSEGTGTLRLMARATEQATSAPAGQKYGSLFLTRPTISDSGSVAFDGTLTGTGVTTSNERALWIGSDGLLNLKVREGDAAPGTTVGIVFDSMSVPFLDGAGRIMFFGQLRGPGISSSNGIGVWRERNGSLQLFARYGDVAPGTGGATFTGIYTPSINAAGQIALRGSTGFFPSWQDGIWSDRSGTLAPVARSGDFAPGIPGGATFDLFDQPAIDEIGQTAFRGSLSNFDITQANNQGLWSEAHGVLSLIAREGSVSPTGEPFGGLGPPAIGNGRMLFLGELIGPGVTDSNNSAIWTKANGPLQLLVREGSQAPGLPAGSVFRSLGNPLVNSAGQGVFVAEVTGTGIDSTNDRGLWAQSRAGILQLVVREGDQIEVTPGEMRTIEILTFLDATGDNMLGRGRGISDSGHLAFRAFFTDGSYGIFVSSQLVPEPHGIGLTCVAAAAIAAMQRFRPRTRRRRLLADL